MKTSLASIALLTIGCSVTDTGNPTDEGGPAGGFERCDEQALNVELDEATPLGFDALAIAALVEGTHSERLAWLAGEFFTSSGTGASDVTVTVTPGNQARFVERQPSNSGSGNEGPALGFETTCNDRLELDATLRISTADGQLDESHAVVFWAETPRLAQAEFTLATDQLTGDLQVTVNGPAGYEPDGPAQLTFSFQLADVGFAGKVTTSATFTSGDVAFGGGGDVARWPENNPCTFGFPVPVEQSENVAAALSAFNGRGPLGLNYTPPDTSAELNYELSSLGGFACEEIEGAQSDFRLLTFAGALALESSDLSIDGVFDVEISAELDANNTVQAVHAAQSALSDDPNNLLASLGIAHSVDFSPYDNGQVSLVADLVEGTLSGNLSVFGGDEAECVDNPPEPVPGQGAPGCSGTNYSELWVASFNE